MKSDMRDRFDDAFIVDKYTGNILMTQAEPILAFIECEIAKTKREERKIMVMAITELFDDMELKDIGIPNGRAYKFVRNNIREWAERKGIKLDKGGYAIKIRNKTLKGVK